MMLNKNKKEIIDKICYTDLVYGRINKKLNIIFLNKEIEIFIGKILYQTDEGFYMRKGKNYYVVNNNIRLTINANTFRVITADRIKK